MSSVYFSVLFFSFFASGNKFDGRLYEETHCIEYRFMIFSPSMFEKENIKMRVNTNVKYINVQVYNPL